MKPNSGAQNAYGGGSGNASGDELLGAFAFQLGNMTTFATARQSPRLVEKAELHRLIAVVLFGANLEHVTRARLHDGHGDASPVLVIDLRHPDLAAEYSLSHRDIPRDLVAPRDREKESHITRDASSR